MEFRVIKNISPEEFRNILEGILPVDFKVEFTDQDIQQTYSGKPFHVSIQPRNGYVRVSTTLESGWPFLDVVIKNNKLNAMSIRYFSGELSEFKYWVNGELLRMQHALKEDKWVWHGKGSIQEWEQSDKYSNRLVKDRLTSQMLEKYLIKCGYNEAIV